MLKFIGTGIVGIIAYILIKKHKQEYAVLVSTSCVILLSMMLLPFVNQLISNFSSLGNGIGINAEFISIIVKSLGICFLTEQASNIALEQGAKSISSGIEIAGKVVLIILAFPMFENVFNLSTELIYGAY